MEGGRERKEGKEGREGKRKEGLTIKEERKRRKEGWMMKEGMKRRMMSARHYAGIHQVGVLHWRIMNATKPLSFYSFLCFPPLSTLFPFLSYVLLPPSLSRSSRRPRSFNIRKEGMKGPNDGRKEGRRKEGTTEQRNDGKKEGRHIRKDGREKVK
jgi:hypothetical protein